MTFPETRLVLDPTRPPDHRLFPDYAILVRHPAPSLKTFERFNRMAFRRSLIGRFRLTKADIGLLYHSHGLDLLHNVRLPNQPTHYGDMTQTVIDDKARCSKKVAAVKPSRTAAAKAKAPSGAGRGGSGASIWTRSIAMPSRPNLSAELTLRQKEELGLR